MSGRRLGVMLVAAFLWTAAAQADEKPNANEAPFEITLQGGVLTTQSADGGRSYQPTTFIDAEGPLVLGAGARSRIFARLGLTSSPDAGLPNLEDVTTFQAAEADLGIGTVVGSKVIGDQEIATSIVAEWGFVSRMATEETQPATRLARHYGAGIRVEERKSKATLTVLYGRDEEAGERGWGQWMVYGSVPVAKTSGVVRIVVDATLSVGPVHEGLTQRDVVRAGVVVDGGSLLGLFKKS